MTSTCCKLVLVVCAGLFTVADLWAQLEPLPPRCFQRFGTTKLRHGSRIQCLAYAPDGLTLAAGGGNDPVRLWHPKTGALIREINEPWVQALTFTASGETLLYGGYQKTVRLWSVTQKKELGRLEGHKATIKAIAVSPDTSAIASGSQDGAICLWRWDIKSKVGDYRGHTDEVTALAFSPDVASNLFASAGSDRVIFIWSMETQKPRLKLDAGCGVCALAWSADGKTLYSAGDDSLIRRWDAATGKQTGVFSGHEGVIVSLFLRGDTLISGSLDQTIRFWNPKTAEPIRAVSRGAGNCDTLAVTKTGDFLATAGTNNTIHVLDAAGKEMHATPEPAAPLVGLALANQRLVSAASDGQISVWNADTGQRVIAWDCHQRGEFHLALAGDGKMLALAGNTLRFGIAATGATDLKLPIPDPDQIVALAFSPEQQTLAIGYRSARLELWNVTYKARLHTLKYPGPLHALAWSPDGEKLAAAGGPEILVWDPKSAKLIQRFDVKLGPRINFPLIASLAFGPEGDTLAAGGFDALIRIYNLSAKSPTAEKGHRVCDGHQSAVYALAFARDGRTLVSGSFDKTVRLWEVFSGKQIALFKGHRGEITGVAFAKDGRSVYSAGSDTVIDRWDVPGLSNNGQVPVQALGPQELDNAWTQLATEQTPRGHEVMWRCIAAAKQAIPHMLRAKKLYLLDPVRVKKLFSDLDSNHYPTRSAAMTELQGYGRWMEGRYDDAMGSAPSLEYKRRVEILKEKLNATNALSLAQERLRVRRFMLMCEQTGGAEAITALQLLADKGPEEQLRAEAKASLRRLKK